ncbi:ribosome hibernation-promoting factor, HPF/YfiA family [Thiohalomonas denitrificans]|uniref:Ribosome hibernation promoting factor n=1 Tax=Thiohalomonas denitrificans TaxID=415747 RepID=A0A1G5PM59_9GAMM|nr:ribosome-associated translation inhibitor RaiA [Thiohalomonas denitrificans]SCZ50624.1 putative sigma-54 modulation protein [Thiohalomonas denitrificans]
MQLNLTGHHVDITPALRDYVSSKLERLERHFDHVTNVHVILTVEKLSQKAEATINITGNQLFANAEDEDMYAAIDALVDKLDRQIRRHKDKVTDHHRDEGAAFK